MKKFKSLLAKPWFAYTFAAVVAVLVYMILGHWGVIWKRIADLWKLLSPVVVGAAIAYLLNPVSEFFKRKLFHKVKRESSRHFLSVLLTVICLVLALAILLTALVPSLVQSITKLAQNWNNYTEKILALIDKAQEFAAAHTMNLDLSKVEDWVANSMDKLVKLLKDNIGTVLSTLGDVGSSVSSFAVGVVFGVCFLFAKKELMAVISRIRAALLTKDRMEKNNALLAQCHEIFIDYVGCTLVDAVIIGVGAFIFLLIMGFPYAALIAAMVGITNIIPTFGPMIGGAIGIFFLILDKPINALWFLIFICIWQSVDGMIIKPRLFKNSLGIPAVWTLVLIILGGKVAGVLGILFAIPVAAIMVILYKQTIQPRLELRAKKINGEAPSAPEAPAADETPAAAEGPAPESE